MQPKGTHLAELNVGRLIAGTDDPMAKEPDNLVLALLRRIDERTERMADDLHDLKMRMTSVLFQINTIGANRVAGAPEEDVTP